MQLPRQRGRWLLPAIALLLVLSGCGSSGNAAAQLATATSAAPTAPTAPPALTTVPTATATSIAATAPAGTSYLLEGQPLDSDPTITLEPNAAQIDYYLAGAQQQTEPVIVPFESWTPDLQAKPLEERAILDAKNRFASHRPLQLLPSEFLAVQPEIITDPQTGAFRDTQIAMDSFRLSVLYLERKAGVVSATLIGVSPAIPQSESLLREQARRSTPGITDDATFFPLGGYTTHVSQLQALSIRPDAGYFKWQARSFSANCPPESQTANCLYLRANQPEAGFQKHEAIILSGTAQLLTTNFPNGGGQANDLVIVLGPAPDTGKPLAVRFSQNDVGPHARGSGHPPPSDLVSKQLQVLQLQGSNHSAYGPDSLAKLPVFAKVA